MVLIPFFLGEVSKVSAIEQRRLDEKLDEAMTSASAGATAMVTAGAELRYTERLDVVIKKSKIFCQKSSYTEW